MTDGKSALEYLKSRPITELSVGKAAFRRSLERKGYSNLFDVLNLTESEIYKKFSLDDASVIETLQKSFRSDQERFAKRALSKCSGAQFESAGISSIRQKPNPLHATALKPEHLSSYLNGSFSQIDPYAYLHLPFVKRLSEYENRAKVAFEDLSDRQNNIIVYQSFDHFATEFNEINEGFQQLFDYFTHRPKVALAFINKFLPNIFLVYVADRARTFHERHGFWKHYFPTIHISPSNTDAQTEFKLLFYSILQSKDMPIYQEDESARHFYLTALLHGGLSRSSWAGLWKDSILPLARSYRTMGNGSQADINGRAALQAILAESSIFAPPKTELDLMKKAPIAIIAPLLESALHVGMQVEPNRQIGSGPTMLTSFGLPDIAIEALIDLEGRRAGNKSGTETAGSFSQREIIALPKADLRLDVGRGRVALCWNKQMFPPSKNTRRIDYYIDDAKFHEQPLHYSAGKCTLDATSIDVEPRPQYEVVLKLMEFSKGTGGWKEIASLEQNFERLNPGCFEFVQNTRGDFCLRRTSDIITRTRTIAYILDEGLSISPGPGMELVEKYESQGTWNGTTISIYKVSPGASGSITAVNEDGILEEIAVWQENYRSSIDKTGVLGTTLGGIDLYGFIPNEDGINIGLPNFYIEAFDGRSALDDLEIICQCDGERVSIMKEPLWEDRDGNVSGSTRIRLSPSKSGYFFFNRHINLCTVEARQRSAQGRLVFKYKFSTIPIQDFHLKSIALEAYDLNATYCFESSEDLFIVSDGNKIQYPNEVGRFLFTTPLSSATLSVRIVSSRTSKSTNALLDLAALDISIPHHLIDRSKTRLLCLADAQAGYNDGRCGIKVNNWSQTRAVLVQLGNIPLYYRELSRPATSDFSIFSDVNAFVQGSNQDAQDLPLSICVFYGYKHAGNELTHAHASTVLLDCREGFGFTSWHICFDAQGNAFVKLDPPLACKTEVVIRPANIHDAIKRGKSYKYMANEGDARIPLPKGIITALHRQRTFEMQFTLLDEFSEFDDLFFDDEEIRDSFPSNLTTTFTLKGTESHGE